MADEQKEQHEKGNYESRYPQPAAGNVVAGQVNYNSYVGQHMQQQDCNAKNRGTHFSSGCGWLGKRV